MWKDKLNVYVVRPLVHYTIGSLTVGGLGFNFCMAHPMADRYTRKEILGFSKPFLHIGGVVGLIFGGHIGHLGVVYGAYTFNNYIKFRKQK